MRNINNIVITLEVRVSWLLFIYLHTVGFLCHLTGMQPNIDRVNYWIEKGVEIKVR